MKKGLKITLIVLGVIVLLAVIAGAFVYFKYLSTSTDKAILNIKEGDVEVNTGKGWVKATDGMKLSLRDSVKTLGNGMALIVLYESVMITLEPNTEVSIKSLSEKNLAVSQSSGSTWNKFSDLAGVKDYNVETPTTVATVRGTGFNVLIEEESTTIDVGEGVVDVKDDGDILKVGENMKALKKKGQKAVQGRIDPQMRMKIAKKMVQDLQNLKELRKKEIMKHRDLIEQARKQYGFTDEQMYDYLDKIDSGEMDDEKLLAKAPVKIPALQKIRKMNDNIKKQRIVMQKLDSELEKMTPEEIAGIKNQRDEIRQNIRMQIRQKIAETKDKKDAVKEQIQEKILDAKQQIQDNPEKIDADSPTAAVIDARYKPDESGEKTITDVSEKVSDGTAVAK